MQRHPPLISRRTFGRIGTGAAATGVLAGPSALGAGPVGLGGTPQAVGAGTVNQPPIPAPESLKSEHLMDLVLETGGNNPRATYGARTIVAVTGGTFEGRRLKGKVVGPGADWPVRVTDRLRILDVRTILVTDDDQAIYCAYRGVVYTPPASEGPQYWRITPIFETSSEKYAWLNTIVAVGVRYTVPQRVAYRVFQVL